MTPALVAAPPASVVIPSKKVLIVMPWQKFCHPITSFCVSQLTDKRRTSSMLNFGDAFVIHSRNHCADHFLKSDLDWMLTIDDDMVVPFGNANWFKMYSGWTNYPDPFAGFNAIDRLMASGKTLVGATYFGKHGAGKPVYAEGAVPTEADLIRKGPRDLVKPTRWVGTGCMLIHRSVYEDIEKRFPNLKRSSEGTGGQWFTPSETNAIDLLQRVRDMLSTGKMDGEKALKAYEMIDGGLGEARHKSALGMGEDVTFCVRAAEAGHQPYVDVGLICGHIGSQVYGPYNTRQA